VLLKAPPKQGAPVALVKKSNTRADSKTSVTASLVNSSSSPVDPAEVITIVAGLPRSGTSMMMQMLVAGKIPPLTDGNRIADASNPKGYYEYDKATQLGSDISWLSEGKGKVVKIVAQLLPLLPKEIDGSPAHYRIVFMERNLEEVVASQRTMLDRDGRQGAKLERADLAKVFQGQLDKVHGMIEQRSIPCIRINHADAIRDPRAVAGNLNGYFGGALDEAAMAAVVDPTLYREKSQ
jgi:hypothetical protein